MKLTNIEITLYRRKALAFSAFAALLLGFVLFFAMQSAPSVGAQAVGTLTVTPTAVNTNTPTPTLVNTPFPLIQTNGLAQYLSCNPGRFPTPAPGDCVQIKGGGSIHIYDNAGNLVFAVDGATGNIIEAGRIAQGPLAIKCVRGEQSVTGAATVVPATLTAANISTPVFVMGSLAQSATGASAITDVKQSAGVVTIEVWNSALTPVASGSAAVVDYQVCGQ